jgi:hypothetical protein
MGLNANRFFVKRPEEKRPLWRTEIDKRRILKCISAR